MAEKHEIVEEGINTSSYNGTASRISEPTSVVRNLSKFATSIRALLRSGRNIIATSSGTTVVRSALPSSTRIERMMRRRSEFASELEFEIDASRVHWSELLESTSVVIAEAGQGGAATMDSNVSSKQDDEAAAHLTNSEVVESLRSQWPETGNFFRDYGDRLVVEARIGEGAQAEIFQVVCIDDDGRRRDNCVLRVFKEGSSVRDLQRQWPHGMFQQIMDGYWRSFSAPIISGTVVMNGRFAFEMHRYWGDLRKLIDFRMQRNGNRHPPFSSRELTSNMLEIAWGMSSLHMDNIIHRDLKASNVLIRPLAKNWVANYKSGVDDVPRDSYYCEVADYECSVGVVGTGFWRAPEILNTMKNRNITSDLFTQKSDVYSYAMTCYEMITGQLPFEDFMLNDYDVVLRGDRPILPNPMESWIEALLSRCWHPDPLERPSFEEIFKCIESNY